MTAILTEDNPAFIQSSFFYETVGELPTSFFNWIKESLQKASVKEK